MRCDALHTGNRFLSAILDHLDCQGRTIGSYGYGALADPASSMSVALTGILTIFVALYGFRLLLGHAPAARDLASEAIKLGLFLAIATSWPAWRVVGYDLVLNMPAEIAAAVSGASGLPGSADDLAQRLQDADDSIVTLTIYGSGRHTGGISAGADLGDAQNGVAVADHSALGTARVVFLATAIGTSGLLHLGAGILLAVAPLMAGLLLFVGTIGIFIGWLRGLLFCIVAGIAWRIIAGAQLALLYSWLTDVFAKRQSNMLTPSAPTELMVMTLAFAFITAGALFVAARITFMPLSFISRALWQQGSAGHGERQSNQAVPDVPPATERYRDATASAVSTITTSITRREAYLRYDTAQDEGRVRHKAGLSGSDRSPSLGSAAERPDGGYRRTAVRPSAAAQRRDRI